MPLNFKSSLAIACVALLCAACSGSSEGTTAASMPSGAAATTPAPIPGVPTIPAPLPTADGAPLVARVNGVPITLETFRRTVARFHAEPSLRSDPQSLRDVVLRTLIEQVLIEQEAARAGVRVGDAELDAELNALIEAAGGQGNWGNWLAQNQYTAEEFRDLLRATMLTNRMRDTITRDLEAPVAQVRARHILVTTRDEAAALLVRLRNGENFAVLATQISLDTATRAVGGDLGWFLQDELLEAELARVAFELQPNQIAGPIQTALGYHILQTLEAAVRPVPEEKRAILAQTRFEQWLTDLASRATIEQFI